MENSVSYPKHWQLKKLGEVCAFAGGGTPSKANSSYWNGEINWASVKDIKGQYLTQTIDKITDEGVFYSATNIAFPDEIILATRIIPGKPIICKIKTAINQDLKIVKPKQAINSSFLYYSFLNLEKDVLKKSNGTTVLGITLSNLNELEIPLPPLPEQQRIVAKIEELFSELDKGVESLKTAQAQLKVYRQAVLKYAFEGKLTEEWRQQQAETKQPKMGMAAEPVVEYNPTQQNGNQLGALPEGWKWEVLKNVCIIKRGKSKHRPRNDKSLFGGNYPFIQTGDVREANGGYITQYSQTYSDFGLKQSKLWPKGTLCITIAANIGETAILSFDACFPDSVVGLLCDKKFLQIKYANYFFVSHKSKLEKLAPATAQKNINVDVLEKIIMPLPSIAEQQKIVSEIERRLSVCDKIEESINQSLAQAETLRQSVLKMAFEGRLV